MTKLEIEIIEVEGEINIIEDELRERQDRLAYLEAEDYDPAKNLDDEYRESDIEYCENDIAECYKELKKLNIKHAILMSRCRHDLP